MKEKNYKQILGKNDSLQNSLALYLLLEHGRINLSTENYYNDLIKRIDEEEKATEGRSLMTVDYKKQILEISRQMAMLKPKEICNFIQHEIDVSEEQTKQNDAVEYDY